MSLYLGGGLVHFKSIWRSSGRNPGQGISFGFITLVSTMTSEFMAPPNGTLRGSILGRVQMKHCNLQEIREKRSVPLWKWSCRFFSPKILRGFRQPPSKKHKYMYIFLYYRYYRYKQNKPKLQWDVFAPGPGPEISTYIPPGPSRVFAGVSWHTLLQASHVSNYPGDLQDSGVRKKHSSTYAGKHLKSLAPFITPPRLPKHAPPSFQAPTTPKSLILHPPPKVS